MSRTLAVAAAVLALALMAGGCSRGTTHHKPGTNHDVSTGSVAPATEPPSATGSDREQQPAGETVEITITGGKVTPPTDRTELKKGARLTLKVTSDTADELHVHGYDKSAELAPGKTASLSFTADRTGLFEVETHESGLVLTQLLVR